MSARKYDLTPTTAHFHADNCRHRGLMGNVNSGKSSACVMEIRTRSKEQMPGPDGRRVTRWLVVRKSYPKLLSTTIPSWREWWPEPDPYLINCPKQRIPESGSPIRIRRVEPLEDGTVWDMEVWFLALDESDADQVGSLQVTGVWINEARELVSFSTVKNLLRPIGRWPPVADGGPTWCGLIMDTNPPPIGSWWYNRAEILKPDDWHFFPQPGAMIRLPDGRLVENPQAENINHINGGFAYYRAMCTDSDTGAQREKDWVNVHVCGQYGNVWEGMPVYEGSYSDERHVSKTPIPILYGPIYLGWDDTGLNPALIVLQVSPEGQVRALREYCGKGTGLVQFVESVVIPSLAREFPTQTRISVDDPAGGARSSIDETTPRQVLTRMGIPTEPAMTLTGRQAMSFSARRDCVISYLNRNARNQPAFIIDPSCQMLRKGFQGGYQFRRIAVSSGMTEHFKEEPEDNDFTHPLDALSYGLLRIQGGGSAQRQTGAHEAPAQQRANWGAF